MTERYEGEPVKFVREFPVLKQSLEEIIAISNARDDIKDKARVALATFDTDLSNGFNRERDPYDQARALVAGFLVVDPAISTKRDEGSEEHALFVGLRSTVWEAVYKIKGWKWPPEKID